MTYAIRITQMTINPRLVYSYLKTFLPSKGRFVQLEIAKKKKEIKLYDTKEDAEKDCEIARKWEFAINAEVVEASTDGEASK